ncbi:hypothetical protein [uncultured Vibrio sp.]|uniref:hypothetical protein n=1 Tax=uncultured Vibrio sp. TaxID=114054 RepID=UPI00263155B2|nr:hypothetical protein [uncultured Vibrio sp.]
MNEIQLSKSEEEALEQEWKKQQAKLDKSDQTVYQRMGGYRSMEITNISRKENYEK